jgi:hypothetical protein
VDIKSLTSRKEVATVSKKVIWAIVIAVGLVLLLTNSKTDVGSTPAARLTPSNSDSSAITPEATSATERNSPTFAGSPCTSDCSGHEAGYNWAEEHGIDDESDCDTAEDTSNSPSFAEGCRAYVQENEPTEDTDDDPDN